VLFTGSGLHYRGRRELLAGRARFDTCPRSTTLLAVRPQMKQWNQVFSTLTEGAEALLAGEPWR
jgi:hypothetical protein